MKKLIIFITILFIIVVSCSVNVGISIESLKLKENEIKFTNELRNSTFNNIKILSLYQTFNKPYNIFNINGDKIEPTNPENVITDIKPGKFLIIKPLEVKRLLNNFKIYKNMDYFEGKKRTVYILECQDYHLKYYIGNSPVFYLQTKYDIENDALEYYSKKENVPDYFKEKLYSEKVKIDFTKAFKDEEADSP